MPTSCTGASRRLASASEPTTVHTTPHTLRMCSSAGKRSTGGTVSIAKKPLTSRGAFGMNSLHHFMTSPVCSIGQNVGPNMSAGGIGWVRNSNVVTTP